MRTGSPPQIPALLIAAKIALMSGWLAYSAMRGVSSISTFSSGALTLSGVSDKARDYAAAGAVGIGALVSFICLYEFLSWAMRRMPSPATRSLYRSLIFANIPAFYALGQILFSQDLALPLFAFSLLSELVLLACSALFMFRAAPSHLSCSADSNLPVLFDWVLPVLLFSLVAGALTPASWASFLWIRQEVPVGSAQLAALSDVNRNFFVGIAAIACMALFSLRNIAAIQKGGCLLMMMAQAVLLLGAIRLVGPLLIVSGKLQYAASLSGIGLTLLVAVTAVSLVHLLFKTAAVLRSEEPQRWIARGDMITPLAATLLALALKVSLDRPFIDLMDDYHTGEFALPYWSWKTFGLLPYVELAPARGWINLLYGLIAEEGLGPHYVSYGYNGIYAALLTLLFLFLALRWSIGTWPALLLLCFAPAPNGLSDIDIVNTGLLAILCGASLVLRPTKWLILWMVLGTAAVLFAPGQGALTVVATGILGCIRFADAIRTERRLLGRTVFAALILTAAIGALTSLPLMIFGAVRYGLEQSTANTEANGIAWAVGAGITPVTSKILWEVHRNAWLIITFGIGASVYLAVRKAGRSFASNPIFVIGLPIVILGLLFIPRAAGRIDPGSWSRLGLTTLWFVSLLLPLFFFFVERRIRPLAVLSIVALVGSMVPFAGNAWKTNPFPPIAEVAGVVDGHSVGLDQLGKAVITPARIDNYVKLKQFVDHEIGPAETFVDLTNRSSLYYLLNRRPPIEVAVYNLTNLSQQARTVRTLVDDPPKLALASSNTILWDGGPLSLRAYLVYRYVVENYRPLRNAGAIWLKRKGDRRGTSPEPSLSAEEIALFTEAFGPSDLGALPQTWGRAWKKLRKQLSAPVAIDLTGASLHDAARAPNGFLMSTGADPFVVIDAGHLNVTGADKGILSFQFDCINMRKTPVLEIMWSNEGIPGFSALKLLAGNSGRLIVPLDASPAWVLGGRLKVLRFDLDDASSCQQWRISDPTLAQRSSLPPVREFWMGQALEREKPRLE